MFSYHLLEALLTVVNTGSFQRAARKLHITQSAISQRISTLEEQLGERLLVRSNPPVPTSRGIQFIAHVRQVMDMEERLLGDPQTEASRRQIIRMGINADSLDTWFFLATKDIVMNEDYLLELVVENEDYTFNRMREGEFYACISSQKKSLPGCEVELLGRVKYRCYCTPEFLNLHFPGGKITAELAKTVPAVIYDEKDLFHERFLKRLGIRNTAIPHHQVPSARGFYETILNGMAYGVGAFKEAKEDIKQGKLVIIHDDVGIEVPWYWHYQRKESLKERQFRKEVILKARRIVEKL